MLYPNSNPVVRKSVTFADVFLFFSLSMRKKNPGNWVEFGQALIALYFSFKSFNFSWHIELQLLYLD